MHITSFVKLLAQLSVNGQAGWVFSGVGPKNFGWNRGGSPLKQQTFLGKGYDMHWKA